MEDVRNHPARFDQFVGSAAVAGASYGRRTTILQLQTFAGEYIDYTIDDIPDPAAADEFRRDNVRPISVRIQHGGQICSVTTLTSDGTRRSNVTLGAALALHQSGVHLVVDGGLQTGVSCSTRTGAKERPPVS